MNYPLPLIIIGAGGHGRVVADSACEAGWKVAGFLDPAMPKGTEVNNIAVLGDGRDTSSFADFGNHAFFVGIGNGAVRWQQFCALSSAGLPVPTIIHPFTQVSASAKLGSGILVAAGAVVQANAEIGDAAIVNTGARIDHDCRVGAGSMIAPGAVLCGNVSVGTQVFIGAGAVVTPGVTIGNGAFVGAGSVVVENLPEDAVYKPIRKTFP